MTETIDRINETALVIFRKKANGILLDNIPEFGQLYHLLRKWSREKAQFILKKVDLAACDTAFHDAMLSSLDSYDGARDFLPFYTTIFKNKLTDLLRREIRHTKHLSLDFENCDDEGNSQGYLEGIIDAKSEDAVVEKSVSSYGKIETFFQMAATICLEKKKEYKRKKCVCYPPLFFTDRLVYSVFDYDKRFGDIVDRNRNKFDEAIVLDFLNTMLTGVCSSVTEIKKYNCRPLSDFTEKQEDTDKPCCDTNPNYHVLNSFLKRNNKNITQPAFSEQYKKFKMLLNPLKDELKLD